MLKKRIFFLMGIFLLLLILFAAGYRMFTKTHQSAAVQEAFESITADSLFSQYSRDGQLADKKYLGKVLSVTGVVSATSQNEQAQVWTLSSGEMAGGINCQMFQNPNLAHPKLGDTIMIKGKCSGFLADVNLVDCVPEDKK